MSNDEKKTPVHDLLCAMSRRYWNAHDASIKENAHCNPYLQNFPPSAEPRLEKALADEDTIEMLRNHESRPPREEPFPVRLNGEEDKTLQLLELSALCIEDLLPLARKALVVLHDCIDGDEYNFVNYVKASVVVQRSEQALERLIDVTGVGGLFPSGQHDGDFEIVFEDRMQSNPLDPLDDFGT